MTTTPAPLTTSPPTTAPPTTVPPTTPLPTTPPPTTPFPGTTVPPTTFPPTTTPSPYNRPTLQYNDYFQMSDIANGGTGNGYSVSLTKDVPFNFQFEDQYGRAITTPIELQNSLINVSFGVDIGFTGGGLAPSGENFATGYQTTAYIFTKDDNKIAFQESGAQRYYDVRIALNQDGLYNYLNYTIYHLPAEISSGYFSGYGQEVTGYATIELNTPQNGSNFLVRQFDVFTGLSGSFAPISGSGGNFFKTYPINDVKSQYSLPIFRDETQKGVNLFYKVLSYDDFDTGFYYFSPISGILDYPQEPTFYPAGIPPVLTFEERTGVFSGVLSPSGTEYDGFLLFESGTQDPYLLRSGQWQKMILASDTGSFVTAQSSFVPPSVKMQTGSVTGATFSSYSASPTLRQLITQTGLYKLECNLHYRATVTGQTTIFGVTDSSGSLILNRFMGDGFVAKSSSVTQHYPISGTFDAGLMFSTSGDGTIQPAKMDLLFEVGTVLTTGTIGTGFLDVCISKLGTGNSILLPNSYSSLTKLN